MNTVTIQEFHDRWIATAPTADDYRAWVAHWQAKNADQPEVVEAIEAVVEASHIWVGVKQE